MKRHRFNIRPCGGEYFEIIVEALTASGARANLEKQYPGAYIEYKGTVD